MNSSNVSIDEFYGVDDEGPVKDIKTENVAVPETKLDLSNEHYEYLQMNFNSRMNDIAYCVTLFQDLAAIYLQTVYKINLEKVMFRKSNN